MSRLDTLIHLVDELDTKADLLISNRQQTNDLLEMVLHSNEKLSTYDIRLDDTYKLLNSKQEYLNGFNELITKTCLFEHNFDQNDSFTNMNILMNINSEFEYLHKKFDMVIPQDESNKPNPELPENPNEPAIQGNLNDPAIQENPINPTIGYKNSFASLNLKPIKCKPNKVYKKKSHYKISNVFNQSIITPLSTFDTNDEEPSYYSHDNSNDSISVHSDYTPESMLHSVDTTPEFEHFDINQPLEFIHPKLDLDENIFHDNESTISNESNFENFDAFLRKSRINLNENSYPYILKTTASNASLDLHPASNETSVSNTNGFDFAKKLNSFEKHPKPIIPYSTDIFNGITIKDRHIDQKTKFHNPIDNIKPTLEKISPTIESIYSTSKVPIADNTTTLLSKVLNTPKKQQSRTFVTNDIQQTFSLRNFLNSPDKTITKTILSLMHNEKQQASPKTIKGVNKLNLEEEPITPAKRRKRKLDKLKNVPKLSPITVVTDMTTKRLPPNLPPSTTLMLNSNKSFIVPGQLSLFRTPMITNYSRRSLQDALLNDLAL